MKIEMVPLSMIEAKKIVETAERDDEEKEIISFLKKFVKLDIKKAKELKKEIGNLGILKLKEEHITKIIDLIPEDVSDINKIFTEIGLDEDETNKLLETIKKYK